MSFLTILYALLFYFATAVMVVGVASKSGSTRLHRHH